MSEHLVDLKNDRVLEITRWNQSSPISEVDNRGELEIQFFDEDSSQSESGDVLFLQEIDDPSNRTYIGKLDGKTGKLDFTPAASSSEAKIN